jgi:hypothetical protein
MACRRSDFTVEETKFLMRVPRAEPAAIDLIRVHVLLSQHGNAPFACCLAFVHGVARSG